jgi:hypothetical protein
MKKTLALVAIALMVIAMGCNKPEPTTVVPIADTTAVAVDTVATVDSTSAVK